MSRTKTTTLGETEQGQNNLYLSYHHWWFTSMLTWGLCYTLERPHPTLFLWQPLRQELLSSPFYSREHGWRRWRDLHRLEQLISRKSWVWVQRPDSEALLLTTPSLPGSEIPVWETQVLWNTGLLALRGSQADQSWASEGWSGLEMMELLMFPSNMQAGHSQIHPSNIYQVLTLYQALCIVVQAWVKRYEPCLS